MNEPINYRCELIEQVLPFWLTHGIDREHGGVITCLDRDGSIYDTDKSVWFQGRFGWLLGTLCTAVEPREEWLAGCRSCVQFLQDHCFDTDGRMFFTTTRDGRPLRKRRYAFSEMFAAMAFAAHAAADNDARSAALAMETCQSGVSRMLTAGGIVPKTIPTTRATKSIGGPMIVLGTAQAIRRSFRAGGCLSTEWALQLEEWINDALASIEADFVRPELEAVLEVVAADGSPLLDHAEGRTINPGHAIEAAWFVMAEGKNRQDSRLINLGVTMLRWSWRLGWDELCGGLFYFRDLCGKPCPEYWHDMKFWWPHNEAEIATLMAWQLTGEDLYRQWHEEVHDWSRRRFVDERYGEWYGWLRRDGEPTHLAKGSLWKGPFHIPRMLLTCWELHREKTSAVGLPNGGPV